MNKFILKVKHIIFKLIRLFFIPIFQIIFGKIKIIGKEKIPKTGKIIMTSNHKSMKDFLLNFNATSRRVFYITRQISTKNKFLNILINSFISFCGGIQIDRDNKGNKINKKASKRIEKILENREEILQIFPEGTRNNTDADLLEVKKGAAHYSIKYSANIYPCAYTGTFKKRNVTFLIGDPITPKDPKLKDLNKSETKQAIVNEIENKTLKLLQKNTAK